MRTTVLSAVAFVLGWIGLRVTAQPLFAWVLTFAMLGVIAGAVMWAVGASRRRREEMDLLREIAAQGRTPEA